MNGENPGEALRILAVDDHPVFREGVRALILGQPDLAIVGEASSGREAIELFRSTRPDITLMDLQMPGLSGIDTITAIRGEFPDARIIVLTTHLGDAYARRALKAGARAYVLKSTARKDLLNTIRDVHRGLRHVEPNVATELAFQEHNGDLSDREIAVLSLIADGNTNRDVGAALGIHEETVKSHVKVILAKLKARDRTHAVSTAMRRGIIPLVSGPAKK
jgi:DNA-binding NarL/FixJ family response regulator